MPHRTILMPLWNLGKRTRAGASLGVAALQKQFPHVSKGSSAKLTLSPLKKSPKIRFFHTRPTTYMKFAREKSICSIKFLKNRIFRIFRVLSVESTL